MSGIRVLDCVGAQDREVSTEQNPALLRAQEAARSRQRSDQLFDFATLWKARNFSVALASHLQDQD